MTLTDQAIRQRLNDWPVLRLASHYGDGAIHQVPTVFVYHDHCLWSPVDGKPKRSGELQRIKNLRANPRANVLLDHYDEDWRQLWWLRIDVEVEIWQCEAPAEDALWQTLARQLREKYPQYQQTPLFSGVPTLLKMAPLRMRSWCAQ